MAISKPNSIRKIASMRLSVSLKRSLSARLAYGGCNWPGLLGICLIISLKDNPIPAGRSGELWGYNQVILKLPS